jgi:hypothetical protein
MAALNVDHDVGVDQIHRLSMGPSFGLLSQNARVILAILNFRSCPHQPFPLPVGNQVSTVSRRDVSDAARGKDAQHVILQRHTPPVSFGRKRGFQFRRQIQDNAHIEIFLSSTLYQTIGWSLSPDHRAKTGANLLVRPSVEILRSLLLGS